MAFLDSKIYRAEQLLTKYFVIRYLTFASYPKYYGYEHGFELMVYKFFDKNVRDNSTHTGVGTS